LAQNEWHVPHNAERAHTLRRAAKAAKAAIYYPDYFRNTFGTTTITKRHARA